MNESLKELRDMMAKKAHGMTKEEAHAKGICIFCKRPLIAHPPSSAEGKAEYLISGIYGDECWDAQFSKEVADRILNEAKSQLKDNA